MQNEKKQNKLCYRTYKLIRFLYNEFFMFLTIYDGVGWRCSGMIIIRDDVVDLVRVSSHWKKKWPTCPRMVPSLFILASDAFSLAAGSTESSRINEHLVDWYLKYSWHVHKHKKMPSWLGTICQFFKIKNRLVPKIYQIWGNFTAHVSFITKIAQSFRFVLHETHVKRKRFSRIISKLYKPIVKFWKKKYDESH